MRRFQSIRNATKCEERTVRYRYGTVHCRVVICHWGGKTRASGGGDLRAGEQKTSRTCSSGQLTRGPDARSFRVFRGGHVRWLMMILLPSPMHTAGAREDMATVCVRQGRRT